MRVRVCVLAWALLMSAASASAATVNTLAAIHCDGQTFLTFNKNSIGGPFSIYRYTSAITGGNIGSATLIATVDTDSWHYLYNESATDAAVVTDLNDGFVVPDSAVNCATTRQMASSEALVVWTTASSGNYYYAVTHGGDSTITGGVNSLSSPVAETHVTNDKLGGVLLYDESVFSGFANCHRYFFWEDLSQWDISYQGYYGMRTNICEASVTGSPQPITMFLHGSGGAAYMFPFSQVSFFNPGLWVVPVDMNLGPDLYTGADRNHNWWFHGHPLPGGATSFTGPPSDPQRNVRYMQFAQDHYNGDVNRWYVEGASGGGGGAFHLLFHYPERFAAGNPRYGAVSKAQNDGCCVTGFNDSDTITSLSMTVEEYWDNATLAAGSVVLPPIFYSFSSDDPQWHQANVFAVTPPFLDAMNDTHRAFGAAWGDHSHGPPPNPFQWSTNTEMTAHPWGMTRFKKNESYPAFYDASDREFFDATPQGEDRQQNLYFDWSSSLHTISSQAITDTSTDFAMAFDRTDDVDATAGLCIWNRQSFALTPGTSVTWTNKAGITGSGSTLASDTTTVGSLGEICMGGLTFKDTGNKVFMTTEDEGGGDGVGSVSRLRLRLRQ